MLIFFSLALDKPSSFGVLFNSLIASVSVFYDNIFQFIQIVQMRKTFEIFEFLNPKEISIYCKRFAVGENISKYRAVFDQGEIDFVFQ